MTSDRAASSVLSRRGLPVDVERHIGFRIGVLPDGLMALLNGAWALRPFGLTRVSDGRASSIKLTMSTQRWWPA